MRSLSVTALTLELAAGAAVGQERQEAAELTGYAPLPLAHAKALRSPNADPRVILRTFYGKHAALLEEGMTALTETKWDGDLITSDIALRGYRDDSLRGENFRIVLRRDGNEWRLTGAGRQSICARGTNRGKAIAGRCP
jgi:hypothetical protein